MEKKQKLGAVYSKSRGARRAAHEAMSKMVLLPERCQVEAACEPAPEGEMAGRGRERAEGAGKVRELRSVNARPMPSPATVHLGRAGVMTCTTTCCQ